MAATLWEKIDEIYPLVADVTDAAEREALLRMMCGADEILYKEISSMLAVDAQLGKFIETPIGDADALSRAFAETQTPDTATRELTGWTIGTYRILSKLGSGG